MQQGTDIRKVDILDTAVFGLLPSGGDRFRRFQTLFRAIAEDDESVNALDAIHIALHWYTAALSSAALDLERTFLSLWIGLEYLIAGHGRVEYSEQAGIIVPIKRYLPRVTALYLPSLLLRDLTNYLYRLVEQGDLQEQGSLGGRLPGPGRWFDEEKLLTCLADQAWTTDLMAQRGADELLRERLLWMQMTCRAGQ